MGVGGSKAASRSYQAVESAAKAAERSVPAVGAVARDEAAARQREQHRTARVPLTLEEEEKLEAKDASLDQLLVQLGGSITGTRIEVTPSKEAMRPMPQSLSLEGRLPPDALKYLFLQQAAAQGEPPEISVIVAKHKPDPALLQRVLSRVCLPETVEAQGTSDVKVFADWPQWFRRRCG